MKFKGKIIALLISSVITIFLWQSNKVMEAKLPFVFFICFAVLLIVGSLIFSEEERAKFKRTYQKLDTYNPDQEGRPKPKTLIILSVLGIGGSLLLGMPALLTYVFCGLLVIFLFRSVMMK